MTNSTKFFGLITFALVAFTLLTGLASAASLSISNIQFPASVDHDDGSFTIEFDVTNNGAADPAVAFTLQMTDGTGTLTMPTVPIGDGTTNPVTISVSGTISFPEHQSGSLVGSVIVDDQGGGSPKSAPFTVTINDDPSISVSEGAEITESSNGTIIIENDGNVDWSDVELTSEGDFTVEFYDSSDNQITDIAVAAGDSETVTVASTELEDAGFGGESVTVTATADDDTTTDSVVLEVEGSFCEAGSVGGDLEITKIDIEVTGEGDEEEWHLLDIIEIEVDVENDADDEIEDVIVELGLFDSSGDNQISDLDFENEDEEEIDLGDIDDGEEETATFRFKVPADFEDGDYRFTVKAYSDDVGEDEQCIDTSSDLEEDERYTVIDVQREDDEEKFIAFDDIEFTPVEPTCGERVSMTLDVFNIGDEDQDQVRVNLRNSALGIDEFIEIRNDLDQGDSETINFEFVIPEDAEDQFYTLALSAEYEYDDGEYDTESEDDTNVQLRIIGCGTAPPGSGGETDRIAIVSANLESDEVVAGGEVVVQATVTNLKSGRAAFSIDAAGYQSWASLEDISPRILDLAEGESDDVLLTFIIDEEIEGEQSFEIEVRDGVGGSEMREIALNVESTVGDGAGFDFGDSAFLWVIGAVNVILVILIIVVAVRVARR